MTLLGICPFNVIAKRSDLFTRDRMTTVLSYFSGDLLLFFRKRTLPVSLLSPCILQALTFDHEETHPTRDVLVSSNNRKMNMYNC